MAQIGLHIDRQPVEADPFAQAHSDGGDLVFARGAVGQGRLFGTRDPDAHAAGTNLTGDVEFGQCGDDPAFQLLHKAPHVLASGVEVQKHIGHPLAGAVIGVLPAAPRRVHGEAVGVGQVLGLCGGAGSVKRRVLQEPDRLGRGAVCNRVCARLHPRHGRVIGDGVGRGDPFRRGVRHVFPSRICESHVTLGQLILVPGGFACFSKILQWLALLLR